MVSHKYNSGNKWQTYDSKAKARNETTRSVREVGDRRVLRERGCLVVTKIKVISVDVDSNPLMTARSQPNDYWYSVAEPLVAQRESTSVMCVVEMFDGNDVDAHGALCPSTRTLSWRTWLPGNDVFHTH